MPHPHPLMHKAMNMHNHATLYSSNTTPHNITCSRSHPFPAGQIAACCALQTVSVCVCGEIDAQTRCVAANMPLTTVSYRVDTVVFSWPSTPPNHCALLPEAHPQSQMQSCTSLTHNNYTHTPSQTDPRGMHNTHTHTWAACWCRPGGQGGAQSAPHQTAAALWRSTVTAQQ